MNSKLEGNGNNLSLKIFHDIRKKTISTYVYAWLRVDCSLAKACHRIKVFEVLLLYWLLTKCL